MRKRVYLIMIFALLVSSQSALSNKKGKLDEIVDRVQKKYNEITDYRADFFQEAEVRALGKTQTASGKVWLKRPDKMKWVYKAPTKEVYISNGNKMLYYNERDNQVLESTFAEISQSTNSIMLLSGLGEIKKFYRIRFLDNKSLNTNDADLLELVPKGASDDNSRVVIRVSRSNSLVDTIYLFDPFGNQTRISLSKVRTNVDIPESVFVFKPPKGTEVIKLPAKR